MVFPKPKTDPEWVGARSMTFTGNPLYTHAHRVTPNVSNVTAITGLEQSTKARATINIAAPTAPVRKYNLCIWQSVNQIGEFRRYIRFNSDDLFNRKDLQ